MSNDDSMLFKIEKLTQDNYHSCKHTMKLYLIGKGLWSIVRAMKRLRMMQTMLQEKPSRGELILRLLPWD